MPASSVNLRSGGLPETVLPPPSPEAAAALAQALGRVGAGAGAGAGAQVGAAVGSAADGDRSNADAPAASAASTLLSHVAARWPRLLSVWAELGRCAAADGDWVASYAYCRVGYHRGLDALRAEGWRGSGFVRWSATTNGGFLWSLWGLGRAAHAIGETDEAQRCAQFLVQLDPSVPMCLGADGWSPPSGVAADAGAAT